MYLSPDLKCCQCGRVSLIDPSPELCEEHACDVSKWLGQLLHEKGKLDYSDVHKQYSKTWFIWTEIAAYNTHGTIGARMTVFAAVSCKAMLMKWQHWALVARRLRHAGVRIHVFVMLVKYEALHHMQLRSQSCTLSESSPIVPIAASGGLTRFDLSTMAPYRSPCQLVIISLWESFAYWHWALSA